MDRKLFEFGPPSDEQLEVRDAVDGIADLAWRGFWIGFACGATLASWVAWSL